jgi:hypothetical protein
MQLNREPKYPMDSTNLGLISFLLIFINTMKAGPIPLILSEVLLMVLKMYYKNYATGMN